MDWTRLLSSERLGDPSYVPQAGRSLFVQDYDRIVFSAPFRRLANKTQVEPLYQHDHVHHRLIHSIEVGSVGRSMATRIGHALVQNGDLNPGDEHTIANIVQAACVAHDIGNPPFGHSGEDAMGNWFAERLEDPHGIFGDIDPALAPEFTAFEGNAQGFRILTRLEMYRNEGGMRLSKATLGAFTKYPVTAPAKTQLDKDGNDYIGRKKFGLFASDAALFAEAATTLGLPEGETAHSWRRHPLVFIVEAADDICYNIVDLEDAFTTGELSYGSVRTLLEELCGKDERPLGDKTPAEHIAILRARGIGVAIDACVEAFLTHYDAIMAGTFSTSLIAAGSSGEIFGRIGTLARDSIFTAQRKIELEVSGRRVIENVMTGILPVYEDLARKKWQRDALGKRADHLVRALNLDLRAVASPYEALHALADFTSGMTDRYALRISRMLSGT